jgi:hypothetical protein
MKKEKGHGSREGGGAFMSNTNYMKKMNNDNRRDMVVGKVVGHLCLTLIIIMKFSVEHDRVVATLNLIKHYISYLV